MSVARAQSEISSREFSEWIAYVRVEPFGAREDARAGVLASLIYNVNRGKHSRAMQPSDFFNLPKSRGPKRTPEQMEQEMKTFVAKHNEAIKNRGRKR